MEKMKLSVPQILRNNMEGTQKVAEAINDSMRASFDGCPAVDVVVSSTAALLINVKSVLDTIGHPELFNDYLDNTLPVIVDLFKDNITKMSNN